MARVRAANSSAALGGHRKTPRHLVLCGHSPFDSGPSHVSSSTFASASATGLRFRVDVSTAHNERAKCSSSSISRLSHPQCCASSSETLTRRATAKHKYAVEDPPIEAAQSRWCASTLCQELFVLFFCGPSPFHSGLSHVPGSLRAFLFLDGVHLFSEHLAYIISRGLLVSSPFITVLVRRSILILVCSSYILLTLGLANHLLENA
ncbi:hypothetical protein K438DRAFT_1852475 [Mycena galopus ATCC 62051]|nr:hypothetical protein K438DRAFT_1852475 [Mycena galopus ATCC 62051]